MIGTRGVVPRVKVGRLGVPVDSGRAGFQFTDVLTTAGSDVCRSTAPMSILVPLIRARPRWSTAGGGPKAGLPPLWAGLVGAIIWVKVGPPLSARGLSWGRWPGR